LKLADPARCPGGIFLPGIFAARRHRWSARHGLAELERAREVLEKSTACFVNKRERSWK
jgi:hypothetical protein